MERPDQNRGLAFILCALLFVMYMQNVWMPYFFGPPAGSTQTGETEEGEEKAASLPQGESASSASKSAPSDSASSTIQPAVRKSGIPTDEDIQAKGSIRIANEKFIATFSLLGGRLIEFLLKEHNESLETNGKKLNLVVHEEGPYPLGLISDRDSDLWVEYTPALIVNGVKTDADKAILKDGQSAELVLSGVLPGGAEVEKRFRFASDSYVFEADLQAPGEAVGLELTRHVETKASGMFSQPGEGGLVWHDTERANHEDYSKFEGEDKELEALRWVTLGDKYFMSTIFSKKDVRGRVVKKDDLFQARIFGNDGGSGSFKLYLGPKSYSDLERLGYELHKNVHFGKTGFVAAPLLWLMHKFFALFGNYGVAIVVLTILVKAVLFPLNSVAFRNMKAMQDLQPDIQRLREQYAKDPQQQQQQIMALYKRKNVNPMGGCFPMLLQLPIFIGLFSALRLAVELRHAPFAFWIKDLSAPESLELFGFSIPFMVVLFVASMIVQQWTMPSTMDATQKRIMMVVPILFGFMFASFPAGLTLYFLINNFISIGQQRALQKGGDMLAVKITALVSVGLFGFSLLFAHIG